MKQRVIYTTSFDRDRLTELIKSRAHVAKDELHLRELQHELDRAKLVDPKSIPADVVTMNSKVLLKDLESGEEMTYTLVFPADADVDEGKISVLAPIGTAILGYRVGATITWKVPAGLRQFQIEKLLYQPEAAGDFHL
jgi:regulator of nucleoside diphosphate kinase